MSDLCTGAAAPDAARERILAWLAEGAREVAWALCSCPRERWADSPPTRPRSAALRGAGAALHGAGPSTWPALRHARHLALRETYLTLPAVRHALGDADGELLPSRAELEHADAAWEGAAAIESAEAIVRGLGDTRFELLQRLEAAPDAAWERPLPVAVATDASGFTQPLQLDWLMLHARQHELEHVAAIWRVALYWDRASPAAAAGGIEDPDERAVGLAPIPCRQA